MSLIYVVKVTANQEKVVSEMLYREAVSRGKNHPEGEGIHAILYTTGLKGYVLVEAETPGAVEDLTRDIPKIKSILLHKKGDLNSAGVISIEELEKTIMPTPVVNEVNKGDLVELIAGPFKGEKARVARIIQSKNEITVELIEAAVPIPITVKGDDIKILRKEEDSGEE